jgi:hypothetical protein
VPETVQGISDAVVGTPHRVFLFSALNMESQFPLEFFVISRRNNSMCLAG